MADVRADRRTGGGHCPAARLGLAALALMAIGVASPQAQRVPDRTLAFYNIHTKETVTATFKRGGRYLPDGLKQVNWALPDWRRDEPTTMDPKLIDLLWEIHADVGSRAPIHVISGYRSPATNAMLRRTVGGQASKSRHMLGQAADVHFPDVPLHRLRYSALIRERGGVGYYPASGIPFVHVDTGRVRAWPRLPRAELALLFPDGRTEHRPSDGGALTPADARRARAADPDLARRVADFHVARKAAREGTLVAALDPAPPTSPPAPAAAAAPLPQLVATPREATRPPRRTTIAALTPAPPPPSRMVPEAAVVDRPSRLTPRPSAEARDRLTRMMADAARGGDRPSPSRSGNEVVARLQPPDPQRPIPNAPVARIAASPDYDADHPEELSYRPFPIAPYLTRTASADDPALLTWQLPDSRRTLELLDVAGEMPPMYLRPTEQVVRTLWAQAFAGTISGGPAPRRRR